jgi:tetratricopeptide (TPR) repeat protein
MLSLGAVRSDMGRLTEAESAYKDALAFQRQLAADFPSRPEFRQALARIHHNLGLVFRKTGRLQEAELAYTDSLNIKKQMAVDFPNRPEFREDLAMSYNNLGVLRINIGRLKAAESDFVEALAIRKSLAAEFPNQPAFRQELGRSQNNLGSLLFMTGQMQAAEMAHNESLATKKQLATDFPKQPEFRQDLAMSYSNLGDVFDATGRGAAAESAYSHALDIFKELSVEFPNALETRNYVAQSFGHLAILHRKQRNFGVASKLLAEAIPYHETALRESPRHSDYRKSYGENLTTLTECCAGDGRRSAALAAASKRRDVGWSPSADTYDAACALARCVPIVEKDDKLDNGKRQAEVQFYSDEAMKMLRDAVGRGYRDVAHMKKDPDLDPLRLRDDFKQLIAELEIPIELIPVPPQLRP